MRQRNKANGQSVRSVGAPHHSVFHDELPLISEIPAVNHEIALEAVNGAVRRGQRAVLFRMLDALSAETELGNFMDQVVTAVAEQFAAHSAYLCVHCEDQNVLRLEGWYVRKDLARLRSTRTFSAQLPRTAQTGSLWQELLRARRPLLVPNALKDSRVPFRDYLSPEGAKNLLLVPLLSGKKPLGLIGIMGPELEFYEPGKIDLAQGLAQQTVVAIQFGKLADNARHAAVLQERSRIARDLHDTLAQGITGILLQMNLAEGTVVQNQQEALRHIMRAQELARGCLEEARHLVSALQPQCVKTHCLATALQQLIDEFTSDTDVRVEFSVQCAAPVLSPEMEAELLRIGQEALTNVMKHACSKNVRIELASDTQCVRLIIQDDGRGFDLSPTTPTRGFGLSGMRERAKQIGAQLEIRSELGLGTQIQVVVPAGQTKICRRDQDQWLLKKR